MISFPQLRALQRIASPRNHGRETDSEADIRLLSRQLSGLCLYLSLTQPISEEPVCPTRAACSRLGQM
jgi:hypothetical protein